MLAQAYVRFRADAARIEGGENEERGGGGREGKKRLRGEPEKLHARRARLRFPAFPFRARELAPLCVCLSFSPYSGAPFCAHGFLSLFFSLMTLLCASNVTSFIMRFSEKRARTAREDD